MIHKDNWDFTKQKYKEYWQFENHDRPLIYAVGEDKSYLNKLPAFQGTLKERWLDIDYQLKKAKLKMNSTYYGGDSFPYVGPDLGPDIFGAMLGCDIAFGEDTSWAVHSVSDWESYPAFSLDKQNLWYKAIKQLTQAFVEDAKNGDYLVGIPDFHPGLDGLVSLRGPQELCYDLYDEPEEIKKRLLDMFDIYQTVFEDYYQLTTKYQDGTTHWMNPWHPNRFYNVSCDFMCMLSPEMFDEFVLEELKKEIALYDSCMFHLDGPAAAKHLDSLLSIESLRGIQWQYGAGNPTASAWIPMMQKIQAAGKNIIVDIVTSDLDDLLENLNPQGLMMNAYCSSKEEAEFITSKVINFHKKIIY